MKSISEPRRLKSQATSSSADTTTPAAFFFANSSRRDFILSSDALPAVADQCRSSTEACTLLGNIEESDAPANLTSRGKTLFFSLDGRLEPQTASTGFGTIGMSSDSGFFRDSVSDLASAVEHCFSRISFDRSLYKPAVMRLGSMPIFFPFPSS